MQVPAEAEHHVPGGDGAFFYALFGRPAAAHIAGRQVDDARFVTHFGEANQRAAAGLFHVVRVRGYRKSVNLRRVVRVKKGIPDVHCHQRYCGREK
jgi:hypothetical protein